MGISGLIPFCEQATRPILINEIRGKCVAIDSYWLLHKGSYCCADKLIKQIKTTAHIDYCMKYVNMLLSLNITPIMVFDGRNLPAKADTESKRRKDRDAAKEKAKEYLREGKTEEARREFAKAVNIKHEHAIELMRECRKLGVDCITAMYEADSQLAYLNKIGVAEFVVSEDSDLILFGCTQIIFKLQLDGRCLLFESSKLHLTLGTTEEKFDFEKFRRICILSGCDYLNSLPGIGLAKARKFMVMTEEDDMRRALRKIPSYLNMRKLTVTDEYIAGFLRAEATFKHMFVFDPQKREMLRLNSLDEGEDPENCKNAGELLNQKIAFQMALGNLNPRTFQQMEHFNPDTTPPRKNFRHPSIWSRAATIITKTGARQQASMSSFFTTSRPQQLTEVQNIIDQENDVTSGVEFEDLLTSYCVPEVSTKRRNSEMENVVGDVSAAAHNPFAKRHQKEVSGPSKSMLRELSKKGKELQVEVNENHKFTSKYFTKAETQKVPKVKADDTEDPAMTRMKLALAEAQKPNLNFYEARDSGLRNESEEAASELNEASEDDETSPDTQNTNLDTEEVIDLEQFQFKARIHKQTTLVDIKPKAATKPKFRMGLSKVGKPSLKKFTSQTDSSQPTLSKFLYVKNHK